MKPLKIYCAGPMTGLPDLNFPAFHTEAARLRALGHEVINPAEINPDKHLTWLECMRTDIAALVFCDAIQMLPGWENSKGATLEHHIAEQLGLLIYLPPIDTPVLLDVSRAISLNEVIGLAYDCNAMPECCTDEGLLRFANAIKEITQEACAKRIEQDLYPTAKTDYQVQYNTGITYLANQIREMK